MPGRIVFCGVGALGSAAAMLCRNLDAELVFVDFDRVESKNLLSQAYVKPSVGKNKAEALKLQLANFHGVKAESFGVRLTRDNTATLLDKATLLVDAFDNAESRLLLSDYARAAGKPLVHAAISADGTFGLIRWDERFTPDEEDSPGQATCEGGAHLPMIGLLGAVLARSIQDFQARGARQDAMVSLSGVLVSG
jgi:molybdopterin/thiamine biosynthesis adenylyltransferase